MVLDMIISSVVTSTIFVNYTIFSLSLSLCYGQRFLASYWKREAFSPCPQSVTPASYTPGLQIYFTLHYCALHSVDVQGDPVTDPYTFIYRRLYL